MKWLLLFASLWMFSGPAQGQESRFPPYFGAIKLQSYDRSDLFLVQQNFRGTFQASGFGTISPDGQWLVVPGLADLSLVSLESVSFRGYYLTQEGDRVILRQDDRSPDLRRRATFRRSTTNTFAGTVTFESLATPGFFLSRVNETSEALLKKLVTIDELKAASFVELLPQGGRPTLGGSRPATQTVFESLWFPGHVLRVFGEDVRAVPRQDVNPKIEAAFIQRPGLAGTGTVSLESVSKPGYYMRALQGRIRIEALSPDENWRKDASFVKVTGLAASNGVSFQSLVTPSFYIGVTGFYEVYLTFISNDVDKKLVTFFETAP
jgi:hypothetical protein